MEVWEVWEVWEVCNRAQGVRQLGRSCRGSGSPTATTPHSPACLSPFCVQGGGSRSLLEGIAATAATAALAATAATAAYTPARTSLCLCESVRVCAGMCGYVRVCAGRSRSLRGAHHPAITLRSPPLTLVSLWYHPTEVRRAQNAKPLVQSQPYRQAHHRWSSACASLRSPNSLDSLDSPDE